MIKINLLPPEDRSKKRGIRLPSVSGANFIWPVAIICVYLGMLFAVATLQSRKVSGLEKQIDVAKQESRALAPQLEKIRQLTKEREEVNRRLNIIADLDKNRYFRVKLLNDISEKMPPNCWLTSVKEDKSNRISIKGVTFSNYIIADFMNNLERSDRFGEVVLMRAEEGQIMDYDVITFSLESKVMAR